MESKLSHDWECNPRSFAITQDKLRLPFPGMVLIDAYELQYKCLFYLKSNFKRNSPNTMKDKIQFFKQTIFSHYSLNQDKAFDFQDSLVLYAWLAFIPETQKKELAELWEFLNATYNIFQNPEGLGLIVGSLTIERIDRPNNAQYLNKAINRLYTFSGKDRGFCSMSRIVYFALHDIWDRIMVEGYCWAWYESWKNFIKVEKHFETAYAESEPYFREIWIELKLHEERHQWEIAEIFERLTNFSRLDADAKSRHLYCFLYLFKFLLGEHQYNTKSKFSQHMMAALNEQVIKMCYLSLNKNFDDMSFFLMLYKLVPKEQKFFADARVKAQITLKSAKLFHIQINQRNKKLLDEFVHQTNTDITFTDSQQYLDLRVSQLVPLDQIMENPEKVLSFGTQFDNPVPRQSQEKLTSILHTPVSKKGKPYFQPVSNLKKCKSYIMKYTEQKIRTQGYIELYLNMQTVYQAFADKIKVICDGALDMEQRQDYIEYLYTCLAQANMMIMQSLTSEKSHLIAARYLPESFVKQFQCEITKRLADMVVLNLNFKGLYYDLYLSYEPDQVLTFRVNSMNQFAVGEIFKQVEHMRGNAGGFLSLYQLYKLKEYYNTHTIKVAGMSEEELTKRKGKKSELQLMVDRILRDKQRLSIVPRLKAPKKIQADDWSKNERGQGHPKFENELRYPIGLDIKYQYIKNLIFWLMEKYVKDSQIENQPENNAYYEMFSCLVMVLENEELILDIYVNVLYTMLSSKNEKLVREGYNAINLIRKQFLKEMKPQVNHSESMKINMVCIYEKIRRLEINVNPIRRETNNAQFSSNQSGRSKRIVEDQMMYSEVYQQYFKDLFESNTDEILKYGELLFSLKKFKEAAFVLQNLKILYDFQNLQQQRGICGVGNVYQNKVQYPLQERIVRCDTILSECYAVIVPEFRDVQRTTNEKCIFNKVSQKNRRKYEQKYQNNKAKLGTNIIPKYNTLLQQVCSDVYNHFKKVFVVITKAKNLNQLKNKNFYLDEKHFERTIFENIARYVQENIWQVRSCEDFKTFYHTILIAGIVYHMYVQKCIEQMNEIQLRDSQKNGSLQNDQQEFYSKGKSRFKQNRMKHGQDKNEKQPFQELFETLLLRNIYLVSAQDRASILELMHLIGLRRGKTKNQILRMHNYALLESGNYQRLNEFLERSYLGEYFEMMTLLDLEVLQKYYYDRHDYQQVKIIAKYMRDQKFYLTHGAKMINCINWPQVLGYDFVAKIKDKNVTNDLTMIKRWQDFHELINQDTRIVFNEYHKYQIDDLTLKDQDYVKGLKKRQPMEYDRIVTKLEEKIKQYFSLLRLIFDQFKMAGQASIHIFRILIKIHRSFIVPHLVSNQVKVDFMFYYLRFFCERVNFEWFTIGDQAGFEKKIKQMNQQKYPLYCDSEKLKHDSNQEIAQKVVKFMMRQIDTVKIHMNYIIRWLDTGVNTCKNKVLRMLIRTIVANNPAEQVWILNFLKHYKIKLPKKCVDHSKHFYPKAPKRLQQLQGYQFHADTDINTRYDEVIEKLRKEVCQIIGGQQKFNSYVQIPEMLMELLQINSIKAVHEDKILLVNGQYAKQLSTISEALKKSLLRIPYPFDSNYYIENVTKIESAGISKCKPISILFICAPFSEIRDENKYIKSIIKYQPSQESISKLVFLKYNHTVNDFMVETNSANFYKELGILDKETTYGIFNMAKFFLMIESIPCSHKSLAASYKLQLNVNKQTILNKVRKFQQAQGNRYKIQPNLRPDYYSSLKNKKYHLKQGQNNDQYFTLLDEFYIKAIQKWWNINTWWDYLHNYIRTLAQWSYLCYLTRLGDRHSDNILLSDDGQFMHIDFEQNFGMGLTLGYPEWVPFRLTELMMSGLGSFREKGVFFGHFVNTAKNFNLNDEKTWKALANLNIQQQELIQHTSRFEDQDRHSTLKEKCQNVILTASNDSLLRFMYIGWLPMV